MRAAGFVSYVEGPEASWLLPPAVDSHQCPIFQARGGSIIGPGVQQQWHCATWRLQAYGEVTATHSADAHSHLGRDRWQEMEKGRCEQHIGGRIRKRGRERLCCLPLMPQGFSKLVPTTTCSCLLSVTEIRKIRSGLYFFYNIICWLHMPIFMLMLKQTPFEPISRHF